MRQLKGGLAQASGWLWVPGSGVLSLAGRIGGAGAGSPAAPDRRDTGVILAGAPAAAARALRGAAAGPPPTGPHRQGRRRGPLGVRIKLGSKPSSR